MRPIAIEQNVIRYPLNEIFGTQANVRLMRVLAEEVMGPIGVSEAAERAGLSPVGARRALTRLAETGFVQRLGGGHSQRYVLRESDPITRNIRELFRQEIERYHALRTRIRKEIESLPEIQAAWIDSPPTQVGKPLQLGILSDSRSLIYLGEQVRQRLGDIEHEFDVIIEIRTFSHADAPEQFLDGTELIAGYVDTGRVTSGRTHADRDERSARLSLAIAELLDKDPSLVKRASRYLSFQLQQDQGTASHDLREWQDILTRYSIQRVKDFLVSDTPRAKRLRQSSPFFPALNPEERDKILAAVEEGN